MRRRWSVGSLSSAVSYVGSNSSLEDLKLCVGLSLVVRYHPDKNANDPKAADIFKEVTFSYNILFDPDKRWQFDTSGFEEKKIQRQFWKHSSPIR
ncbi:hypothetical protein ACLB2K_004790 [Fragaria x ananassa]